MCTLGKTNDYLIPLNPFRNGIIENTETKKPLPMPILSYDFTRGSNDIVTKLLDRSGNSNNGELKNHQHAIISSHGIQLAPPCKKYLVDCSKMSYISFQNLGLERSFSVVMKFQITSPPINQVLFTMRNGWTNVILLELTSPHNMLSFSVATSSWDKRTAICGGEREDKGLQVGETYTIVATYSEEGSLTLYVDGVEVANGKNTEPKSDTPGNRPRNWIGRAKKKNQHPLDVLIKSVYVFDCKLSQKEVNLLEELFVPTSALYRLNSFQWYKTGQISKFISILIPILPNIMPGILEIIIEYCKVGMQEDAGLSLRMNFQPGSIGMSFRGDLVSNVVPRGQASIAGVCNKWRIIKINNKKMNGESGLTISDYIQESFDNGKPVVILFDEKISVGDRVRCRNTGEKWKFGVVTADDQIPKVKTDDSFLSFPWDEIQHVDKEDANNILMIMQDSKMSNEKELKKQFQVEIELSYLRRYKIMQFMWCIFCCVIILLSFFLLAIPLAMDGFGVPLIPIISLLLIAFGLPFIAGILMFPIVNKLRKKNKRIWMQCVGLNGSFFLFSVFLIRKLSSSPDMYNFVVISPLLFSSFCMQFFFLEPVINACSDTLDIKVIEHFIAKLSVVYSISIFLILMALRADMISAPVSIDNAFIPLWIGIIIWFGYTINNGVLCFGLIPTIVIGLIYIKFNHYPQLIWTVIFLPILVPLGYKLLGTLEQFLRKFSCCRYTPYTPIAIEV